MDLPTPAPGIDLADLDQQYWDNAEYDERQSPAMCRRFISTCRRLIRFLPQFADDGITGQRIAFDLGQVREEMTRAQNWLASTGARLEGQCTRYADLSGMRRWGQTRRPRDWGTE